MDGWPAIGRSSFFFMSGDSGDGADGGGRLFCVGGWVDVRNNLAGFHLFRSPSVVCSFFCLKKSLKIHLKKQ